MSKGKFSRHPNTGNPDWKKKPKRRRDGDEESHGKGQGRPKNRVHGKREERNRPPSEQLQPLTTIMDSSLFLGLSKAYQYALDYDKNFEPLRILEELAKPPRTLVIPRTVLQEIYNVDRGSYSGSYGMYYDDYEGYGITIRDHSSVRDSAAKRAFAHTLLGVDGEEPNIRFYGSAFDMCEAGELSSMEGGIVVVDSIPPRQGIEPLNGVGKYKKLPTNGQTADKEIMHLCKEIHRASKELRLDPQAIGVVTNDRKLADNINALPNHLSHQSIKSFKNFTLQCAAEDSRWLGRHGWDVLRNTRFGEGATQDQKLINDCKGMIRRSDPRRTITTERVADRAQQRSEGRS